MPVQLIDDNIWRHRLPEAENYYKEWAKHFQCDVLEKYYEGQQWKLQGGADYKPYVINKFYETMQIKIAQFLPTFPKYLVSARPMNSEFDQETGVKSATLKQDVLNSVVQNDDINFVDELEQIYKDSFTRFGICEVGYGADWVNNPNAPKPLLKGQTDKNVQGSSKYKISKEPEELPLNERIYFRHIPAKRFRVGGIDHRYLNRCSWVGYYDWMLKDDLLSLKGLMNRDKLDSIKGSIPGEPGGQLANTDEKYWRDVIKVWHIWDLRSKLQLLIINDPITTVFQRGFKRLPLFDYRPDRRLIVDGFYPIPPAFHWVSPQDEFNECREMLRAHRRRFIRKFQVIEGMIDDVEIEKFESQQDGAIIKVKRPDAITAIQDAPLGQAINEAILTSSDDLNRVSGSSSESRGVADRTTATQAKIVDTRAATRENKERDRLVRFFSKIGREALLLVQEKFSLGLLVKLSSQEGEDFLGIVQQNQAAFKWFTSEELNDGYDFRINVDVTSLSTTAQADEEQCFLKFMSYLTQFPFIAFSPKLVREAAYRAGYRNESVIAEMQKMALLMEQGRMMQLQMQNAQLSAAAGGQGAGGGSGGSMPAPGNAGQQIVAQQTPPNIEEMRNQMANQLTQ